MRLSAAWQSSIRIANYSCGRRHYTPEYIHHLRFSSGSSNERQTQVELSKRVEIVWAEEAALLIADAEEVGRVLHGLIGSLKRTTR